MNFEFRAFFHFEDLRLDGSNLAGWYYRLMDTLKSNNLLFVLEEPLGDPPGDSASKEDDEQWHDHHDVYCCVETLMRACMHSDLQWQFNHSSASDMIAELKVIFAAQVRAIRFECLSEFLSTMMEEKTCLDQHLMSMHEIHRRLTYDWDYLMSDEMAIIVVLHSLPLSYKSFVMKGEQFTFFAFLA